jgi:membrane protein involved in colicin uptake
MHDLIWAGVVFVSMMTFVAGMLGPLRYAVTQWGDAHGQTSGEREAQAALALARAEETRHELAVRRENLAEEAGREKARLAAETAEFETGAAAARECLPAAVEARQAALKARADAEAALAPEAARKALDAANGEVMQHLATAYAAYCQACADISATPSRFSLWAEGFNWAGGPVGEGAT